MLSRVCDRLIATNDECFVVNQLTEIEFDLIQLRICLER